MAATVSARSPRANCTAEVFTATWMRPIAGVPPQLTLVAGIPQHARADGHDQAAFFRDGNQNRRRDASELRIVPAHQRLQPGDAPGGQIELRLVMDGQFVALQGMVQFRFDGQAAVGVLADFRVGQLDAAACPARLAAYKALSAARCSASGSAPSCG